MAARRRLPEDMLSNKLIDGVIQEPMGGAHHDPGAMAASIRQRILSDLKQLRSKDISKLIVERIDKFSSMGVVNEQK